MRPVSAFLLLAAVSLGAAPPETLLVRARLKVEPDWVMQGGAVRATVSFEIEPGWHIYAEDPGEAGMATSVEWVLPEGLSAGPLEWPKPETFKTAEITTYGYERQLALSSEIRLADHAPIGLRKIVAETRWLACREECVPGKARVEAEILVSPPPSEASP